MDLKCPACGSIYYPGEKFCQNCGTKLPTEPPAAPAYETPAAPAYEAPAAPAYETPAAPVYEAPAAPAYEAPAAPAYEAPAAPVYNAPAAPVYQQPAAPMYQPPAAPTAPGYQPAPSYAQPTYDPNYAQNAAPKKKKTGLIIGLIAGAAVLIAAAILLYFFVFASPSPDSVSLSETALTLEPWGSTQLTATILPEKASEDKLTWASSDEDVATVYEGNVTAWDVGSCTVTVTTSNGLTATCYVTVEAAPTMVDLSEYWLTLEAGETKTLDVTVYPENATNYTIDWATSDASVATVLNGVVTAVGSGDCEITATTSNGLRETCYVTVGVAASGIDLSDSWLDLYVGDTQALDVAIIPENATNYTINWTTSDASVATVRDGEVTAVGEGECTVTAAISEDVYAECSVSVTKIDDSEYDSSILGDWRLTLSYDWETKIDSPASELGLSGSLKINSDHTGIYTVNDDSFDIHWGFEEMIDAASGSYSVNHYRFWLELEDETEYEFDYVTGNNEIWLYIEDAAGSLTYTFEK